MRRILGPHVKWDFWGSCIFDMRSGVTKPMDLFLHSAEQITYDQAEEVRKLVDDLHGVEGSTLVIYKDFEHKGFFEHGPMDIRGYRYPKPPWAP